MSRVNVTSAPSDWATAGTAMASAATAGRMLRSPMMIPSLLRRLLPRMDTLPGRKSLKPPLSPGVACPRQRVSQDYRASAGRANAVRVAPDGISTCCTPSSM